MEKNNYTLSKAERISNRKDIERLFAEGNAFLVFPLRVVYLLQPNPVAQSAVSILVNVSKKRFKKAVIRNRLKRLIKEAYRLNKHMLFDSPAPRESQLLIAFQYVHQEEVAFRDVEKSMKKIVGIFRSK